MKRTTRRGRRKSRSRSRSRSREELELLAEEGVEVLKGQLESDTGDIEVIDNIPITDVTEEIPLAEVIDEIPVA
jgi:hypothetical protein